MIFLKRLAAAVPLLAGILFMSFAVIRLAPGTAVDTQGAMNPRMTAQAREKLAELYGLDKPLLAQFAAWGSRAVRLDFGRSFVDGEEVTKKIGEAIPVTLLINGLSLLLILLFGIPLGVWSAVREGSAAEKAATFCVFLGFSVPTFWLSLLLMSWFGVTLRILPVAGLHALDHETMSAAGRLWDTARHLALPVAVSALTGLAGISRLMHGSLVETLRQNYIRTARAKGLSERSVLYGHALRNALLPVATVVGLSIPGLLGGSVIFESIFSIPGMGRLFFSSVFARDYPVIMGVLVLGAALTLLGNLLADLSYAAIDPRIRAR
ncbi:MAG TPA: ABC transporter permease [Candidatus Eisenbacteria bacterium]|nr:ABC transporter permease [Candidatus Eisenbacteria bacterium]